MALALQDENIVWQKVNKALSNQSGGPVTGTAASPISQNAFRALKLQMATSKLAPQLQFVPFSYANLTGATGYLPGIGVAGHVYGIYAHKSGTGTTGSFLSIDDAASGNVAGRKASFSFTGTLDEVVGLWPQGLAFATDLTIGLTTTITGTTESSGAGDVIQGFAIIGA
jgi:hypothetical protein